MHLDEALRGDCMWHAEVGDIGPGTRAAFDKAAILQVLIRLCDRHGRHAGQVRHFADRRQLLARRQLSAADAVFDQASELRAQRYRQSIPPA